MLVGGLELGVAKSSQQHTERMGRYLTGAVVINIRALDETGFEICVDSSVHALSDRYPLDLTTDRHGKWIAVRGFDGVHHRRAGDVDQLAVRDRVFCLDFGHIFLRQRLVV